jgi:hypothetical protein
MRVHGIGCGSDREPPTGPTEPLEPEEGEEYCAVEARPLLVQHDRIDAKREC